MVDFCAAASAIFSLKGWRHMGHAPLLASELIQCDMQCIWKQCEHSPMTVVHPVNVGATTSVARHNRRFDASLDLLIGQSSPGYLHFSQVPSNCDLQMPQVSSAPSGRSHFHSATAR